MKESTEQLKEIFAGKPDGATHVESLASCNYWDLKSFALYAWDSNCWEDQHAGIQPAEDFRSLADIAEIVVLREEVERLRQCVESTVESFNLNEIRAQAVEDFMDWVNSNLKRGRDIWSMAEEYANNLRNQKEGE